MAIIEVSKQITNYLDSEETVTAPANPVEGQRWTDTSKSPPVAMIYKNGEWKAERLSVEVLDPDFYQDLEDTKTEVATAVEKAEAAEKAGQDAQAAGEAAQQAAEEAKQVGEAAKVAGAEAKAAAEDAGIAAADAKAVGADAKLAAEDAKAVAEDAKLAGKDAQQSAEEAKQAGEDAANLATQADAAAKAAKAKADAIEINVSGVVSDVASINANVTAVSAKANDAYAKANAVEGRTSTLETSVTGLTGRLTDVESTSTSTTKKLNELVVTVDGQKQTLATTTTTAYSALSKANVLEETVDGVKTTLTSLETDFNNLSIGGRNYITDTSRVRSYTGSGTASNSSTETNFYFSLPINTFASVGDTFTFSAKMDITGSGFGGTFRPQTAPNGYWAGLGSTQPITKAETINFSVPLTINQSMLDAPNTMIQIRFDNVPTTVKIDFSKVMLSKGNKPTDWSPAPEDLATVTKVNQITETVDGHTQLIASTTNTANSALSKATSTEITVNGLKNTVIDVQTTANSALTKATSVEQTANGLTTTVTNIQSDISDITNRFPDPNFSKKTPAPTLEGNGMISSYDANGLVLQNTSTTTTNRFYWPLSSLLLGKTYNIKMYVNVEQTGVNREIEVGFSGGENLKFTPTSTTAIWISGTVKASGNARALSFWLPNGVAFRLRELYLYEANTNITSSQITQLSDTINLKVSKNDVVNQINLSTEGILIAGNKIQIIGSTYIEDAVIKTAHIADLAVSIGKIANLAVTEGKIANLAVTNAKIANLSVTEGKIGDAAITNAKIGNLAVSEAKIASLAVTEAKVGDAAITNAKIGNLAVSEAKIASLAVSEGKIANLAVTEGKIGNLAVTTAKIADLAVNNAKIASLDAAKINTGYLAAARIAASSITTDKLNVATLSAITANLGNVTAGTINGVEIIGGSYTQSATLTDPTSGSSGTSEVRISGGVIYNSFNNGTTSDRQTSLSSGVLRFYSQGSEIGRIETSVDLGTTASPAIHLKGTFVGVTSSQRGWINLSANGIFEGNTYRGYTIDAGTNTGNYVGFNRNRSDLMNLYAGKTSDGSKRLGSDDLYATSGSGKALHITSGGTIVAYSSSERFKEYIEVASDVNPKALLTLDLKSWIYKSSHSLVSVGEPVRRIYGLIAEDVERAGLNQYVERDITGRVEGYKPELWTTTIPILKDHEESIEDLKTRVKNLEEEIEALRAA